MNKCNFCAWAKPTGQIGRGNAWLLIDIIIVYVPFKE